MQKENYKIATTKKKRKENEKKRFKIRERKLYKEKKRETEGNYRYLLLKIQSLLFCVFAFSNNSFLFSH